MTARQTVAWGIRHKWMVTLSQWGCPGENIRGDDNQFTFWWFEVKICLENLTDRSQWRALLGSWIHRLEDLCSTYWVLSDQHIDKKWSCRCVGDKLSGKKRQKGTCTFEYSVHSWQLNVKSFNNSSLRERSGKRQHVTLGLRMGRGNRRSGERREIILRVAFITEQFLWARSCAETFICTALLNFA